MRKFYLLLMLSPFIIVGLLKLSGMRMLHEPKPALVVEAKPQALLMIFDGDKVIQEFTLSDRSVFLLKKDGVFYIDTTHDGFWKADWNDLSRIGVGHQKEILKRVKVEAT